MPINGRRVRLIAYGLTHQPHCAPGESFAEHDSSSARFDDGIYSLDDFVRSAADVRREDQSQPAAFVARLFDRCDCALDPFRDGGIVEVGIEIFILFDEEEKRT